MPILFATACLAASIFAMQADFTRAGGPEFGTVAHATMSLQHSTKVEAAEVVVVVVVVVEEVDVDVAVDV